MPAPDRRGKRRETSIRSGGMRLALYDLADITTRRWQIAMPIAGWLVLIVIDLFDGEEVDLEALDLEERSKRDRD